MFGSKQVPGPYEDTTCQMVMAYGDNQHRHLETIREFRDTVLSSNRLGRLLIDFYYRHTPMVARLGNESKFFRNLILYLTAYPAYFVSSIALRMKELNSEKVSG